MMEVMFITPKGIPSTANRLDIPRASRSEITRVVQIDVLELLGGLIGIDVY